MEKFLGKLPQDIVSKIMMFNRHPVADLLTQSEAYREYHDEQVEMLYEGSVGFTDVYFMAFYCSHCGEQNSDCRAGRIQRRKWLIE
jgi:hypothetical protein